MLLCKHTLLSVFRLTAEGPSQWLSRKKGVLTYEGGRECGGGRVSERVSVGVDE